MADDAARTERHRSSVRLKGYDYSRAGAYFITVCAKDRVCLFGDMVGEEMRLNAAGLAAEQCWVAIPEHFPFVELDEFVVMPNHVHGIVFLTNAPTTRNVSVSRMAKITPKSGSLSVVVRSFKSAITKRINELRASPGVPVWQYNYYEHIIRDEESLDRIRQYIADNPAQWAMDHENPAYVGTGHDRVRHNAVWANHGVAGMDVGVAGTGHGVVGALHATPLRVGANHGG
jgi:REP element-mobilizing transposase RayT